jgi:hypothetical protein
MRMTDMRIAALGKEEQGRREGEDAAVMRSARARAHTRCSTQAIHQNREAG